MPNAFIELNAHPVEFGCYVSTAKPSTVFADNTTPPNPIHGTTLGERQYHDAVMKCLLSNGKLAKANVPLAFFPAVSKPDSGRNFNTVSLAFSVLDWLTIVNDPATDHEATVIRNFMDGDAASKANAFNWLTDQWVRLFVGIKDGPAKLVNRLLPPSADGRITGDAPPLAVKYTATEGVDRSGKPTQFLEIVDFPRVSDSPVEASVLTNATL